MRRNDLVAKREVNSNLREELGTGLDSAAAVAAAADASGAGMLGMSAMLGGSLAAGFGEPRISAIHPPASAPATK